MSPWLLLFEFWIALNGVIVADCALSCALPGWIRCMKGNLEIVRPIMSSQGVLRSPSGRPLFGSMASFTTSQE